VVVRQVGGGVVGGGGRGWGRLPALLLSSLTSLPLCTLLPPPLPAALSLHHSPSSAKQLQAEANIIIGINVRSEMRQHETNQLVGSGFLGRSNIGRAASNAKRKLRKVVIINQT